MIVEEYEKEEFTLKEMPPSEEFRKMLRLPENYSLDDFFALFERLEKLKS